MKAFLMFKERDFDPRTKPPKHAGTLTEDLELGTLVAAMAQDDPTVAEISRQVLLSATGNDRETILYRQDILQDCCAIPEAPRTIYALAGGALEAEKKHFHSFFRAPSETLRRSVEVMRDFVGALTELRGIARDHATSCRSQGLRALFETLERELSDDYLAKVSAHLDAMKFDGGVLMSASLGDGNKGAGYVLRQPTDVDKSWFRQIFGPKPESYTFYLPPRDDAGAQALSELSNRGLALIADALARSVDHILSFFRMLRTELAFYVGCLNLRTTLIRSGLPVCRPEPAEGSARGLRFQGLYDVCLALHKGSGIAGNTLDANGRNLIFITGANQGGKSTFLRSLGLAQMMMQGGMFVSAESFYGTLFADVFTHYRREEDRTMESGKFDEELSRMSGIVDDIRRPSLLLFNESFASTNEREGSEVARQIVRGLLDRGMSVVFVTHMYDLAHSFDAMQKPDFLFLRAERRDDGERSFLLSEGEPLPSSFGIDLYRTIFGEPTFGENSLPQRQA
jgi:hypothetical protein